MLFVNSVVSVYFDSKIASTFATSVVRSKLDCSNSRYYNLSKSPSAYSKFSCSYAVVKAHKCSHVSLTLIFVNLSTGSKASK